MPTVTVEEIRRKSAAALLEEPKLDALLITNLHNVRYLTGFTGSNGAVLLFRDAHAVLMTDPRYAAQSRQQANCRIRIAKGPLAKTVLGEIRRSGLGRVGF